MYAFKFSRRTIASLLIFLISFQTCFTNVTYANELNKMMISDIASPSNATKIEEDGNDEVDVATPNNASKNEDKDEDIWDEDGDLENDLDIIEDDKEELDLATPSNAKLMLTRPDFYFNLQWEDSYEEQYILHEENANASNKVKMIVSYGNYTDIEDGYKPGDLVITVQGIGNVNRNGVIEATVGADKDSSTTKTRDWSYTWNKLTDTYTFTNNKEIKPHSMFSGYFELMWNIKAKDSIHGYEQSEIYGEFFVPDSDSVESYPLYFVNETKTDEFKVGITKKRLITYEGLGEGILENPDEYDYIRYDLTSYQTSYTRSLREDPKYYFNPDVNNIGTGAVIVNASGSYKNLDNGISSVGLSFNRIDGYHYLDNDAQYIYVAYPKDKYKDIESVEANLTMYGNFYEGDDNGEHTELDDPGILAEANIILNPSKDFNFIDEPGTIYDYEKESYYERNYKNTNREKEGDIIGRKMVTGTEETFYLYGSVNVPREQSYKLEIVDDFLYILQNNGTYRELEVGEYEFSKITIPSVSQLKNSNNIPIKSDTYKIKIYAESEPGKIIDISNDEQLVHETKLTNRAQIYNFKNSHPIKIAIVIESLSESINKFDIPVTINFHTDEEKDDNLKDGKVINNTFIRIYKKDGTLLNSDFDKDNYEDDTELGLADKDHDLYGDYLDREKGTILFYEGVRSRYDAYTNIENATVSRSGVKADLSIGARFTFNGEDKFNKFSLYTILPEGVELDGYRLEEDIWDIMKLSGLSLEEEDLSKACKVEIDTDYKESGRTYIRLNFDFGDRELSQSGSIYAKFKIKTSKDQNIYARSCVILEEKADTYNSDKRQDNGSWSGSSSDRELFSDIDEDNNIEELLDYDYDTFISPGYADSSSTQITKFVETTYSDGWVQDNTAIEQYDGQYRYNLNFTNGNNKSTHIIVRDNIEKDGEWHGTLESVDLSQCEGLEGTVYYSTKTGDLSEDLMSDDWTTEYTSEAKQVAIDFGESELGKGQEISVILNMRAPVDDNYKNKVTRNSFHLSADAIDLVTGNITQKIDFDSNEVKVKLTPSLRNVVVTKEDSEDRSALIGAVFELLDENGEILDEAETNSKGFAIFKDIPANNGETLILREKKEPYGYILNEEDTSIVIKDKTERVTVTNDRKLGAIKVHKVNDLDRNISVNGATYELRDINGNVIDSKITDTNGELIFTDVKWGKYTVVETESPEGYKLSTREYKVIVDKDTVQKEINVLAVDEQEDCYLHLVKYEKDTKGNETKVPLSGVTFELVKEVDGKDDRIGLYVTDKNGEINVGELSYGKYYFREYSVPKGYEKYTEKIWAELTPSNRDIKVTVYNQRKTGSILITKRDNLGNMVEGCTFTLYDVDGNELGNINTDKYGVAQFENLEWGEYIVSETYAPKYYNIINGAEFINISNREQNITLDWMNETVKGSVRLTKYGESIGGERLSGAYYTLYKDDGSVVGTYCTDGNGEIIVDYLEWGAYYFKEVEPPSGYGLSNESIRFSINSKNACTLQELSTVDKIDAKYITIVKRIKRSDINLDNGLPTFIFKIDGEDITSNKKRHTYYRTITFTEDDIWCNIDSDGYVNQSIAIGDIVPGNYIVSEEEVGRYELDRVEYVENGEINEDEKSVTLNLVDNPYGMVVFENARYESKYFSDTDSLNNVVKEKAKVTALSVEYADREVEAGSEVDLDKLTVVLIYDDGSIKEVTDYNLKDEDTVFPKVNGPYTISVEYEFEGKHLVGSDIVDVVGGIEQIIALYASHKNTEKELTIGDEIKSDMFEVYAIYNSGYTSYLENDKYIVSPSIVPEVMGEFPVKISLNLDEVSNDGREVNTEVILESIIHGPVMISGPQFRNRMLDIVTSIEMIVFSDESMPNIYDKVWDLSENEDGSVVGWLQDNKLTISTQKVGTKVLANQNLSSMFSDFISLKSIDFKNLDTRYTNNMCGMFDTCELLTELDLSKFNTSNVTNMIRMFSNCLKLEKVDLSSFDTSKVESMFWMFDYCKSLTELDLSNFNTSNVTDMSGMFRDCIKLIKLNVSSFDTSNVESMHEMFSTLTEISELDISNFDTSKVTDMYRMFGYNFNLKSVDVSGFNTSKVENMKEMFYYCQNLDELYVSNFDTSNVTSMSRMFMNCVSLIELDVSNFDTSNVTDMSEMFEGCRELIKLDLSSFNTSNVKDMSAMFYQCWNLDELDVSNFDTSNVTDMSYMFGYILLKNIDLSNFNTSNVISMFNMFCGCGQLNLDCSSWDVSKVTNHKDFNGGSPGVIPPNFIN